MERGGKEEEEEEESDSKEDLYVTERRVAADVVCCSVHTRVHWPPIRGSIARSSIIPYLPRVSTTEFHAGLSIDFSIT